MDVDKIIQMVKDGLTQRQIAAQLGVSQGCIKYRLEKLGLKTAFIKRPPTCCVLCGETDKNQFYFHKDGRMRNRCRACECNRTIERFRDYKRQAVDYKGGSCSKCGYSKCLGSLDFHHLDPNKKDPNWKRMRNWPLEKVKAELDKCILVCKNCHGEIHFEMKKKKGD